MSSMYTLETGWEGFYRELDPEKRKTILKDLEAAGEGDAAIIAFRRQLLEKRYTNPKEPGSKWDLYLQQCAVLPSLYRKRKSVFVNTGRELQRTLAALGLENPEEYSEEEKTALYWEFRNTADRYFKTCSGSKYGSSFLGLSKADDMQKLKLAARDAWEMSEGIARFGKIEKEMQIFCDAVKDAFIDRSEDGEELYQKAAEVGGRG